MVHGRAFKWPGPITRRIFYDPYYRSLWSGCNRLTAANIDKWTLYRIAALRSAGTGWKGWKRDRTTIPVTFMFRTGNDAYTSLCGLCRYSGHDVLGWDQIVAFLPICREMWITLTPALTLSTTLYLFQQHNKTRGIPRRWFPA